MEKVNPHLIVRDAEGKPYTVRYEAITAMLLNEFFKEHQKMEKLEAIVAKQKDIQAAAAQQQKEFESKLAEQHEQIKALTSGLENVRNQLELNKPVPQMVSIGD